MKYSKLSFGILAGLMLFGCGEAAQQSQQMPVLTVSAADAQAVTYHPSMTYSGRLEALEDVTISAQVSGSLKSRHFVEGDFVEAGDLLFQLDPAIYETQVAIAKAALAQAQSAAKLAKVDQKRAKELLPKGSISRSEYDRIIGAAAQGDAQVAAAKAQLQAAELNLEYTQIKAPISGRISRSSASIGDLIAPSTGALATLVSIDPIAVQFAISEREVYQFAMDTSKETATEIGDETQQMVVAYIGLGEHQRYSQPGKISYVGNRINRATGTLDMRAEFPNPKAVLLPGQYADVTLEKKEAIDVVTVPRRSVQTDLSGDFVMVVGADNVVERVNVTMGPDIDNSVIVTGLEPGVQVLTSGLQRVRPGSEVNINQPTEE